MYVSVYLCVGSIQKLQRALIVDLWKLRRATLQLGILLWLLCALDDGFVIIPSLQCDGPNITATATTIYSIPVKIGCMHALGDYDVDDLRGPGQVSFAGVC